MPPHSLYVEPFAGSAQVFFRKRPADLNVLIDVAAAVTARLGVACRRMTLDAAAVDVITSNSIQWLQRPIDYENCVIYCDPPYMLHTRTKQRLYGPHEMTDDDHAALLAALLKAKCYVMISGYPSKLYSSQLRDWRCCSYRTRTRGRTVTECLWMNFPEPAELHDWRYAGQSHRQRVSFKRLATRWLTRLDGMPPRQRGYLLATIAQRQDWQARPPTPLLT